MALSFCIRLVVATLVFEIVLLLEGCGNSEPDVPDVVKVSVSPAIVASGSWVTVSYSGVSSEEMLRPSTEYICRQDGGCRDVQNISLWIGVFEKSADRSTIGPQDWACANPPWLATSPVKWKPVNASKGEVSFLMQSPRVSEFEFVLFSNGAA